MRREFEVDPEIWTTAFMLDRHQLSVFWSRTLIRKSFLLSDTLNLKFKRATNLSRESDKIGKYHRLRHAVIEYACSYSFENIPIENNFHEAVFRVPSARVRFFHWLCNLPKYGKHATLSHNSRAIVRSINCYRIVIHPCKRMYWLVALEGVVVRCQHTAIEALVTQRMSIPCDRIQRPHNSVFVERDFSAFRDFELGVHNCEIGGNKWILTPIEQPGWNPIMLHKEQAVP